MRRLDFKNTHGHQGTIAISGREKTKFFSDKLYGGFEGSREAARAWEVENGKVFKPHARKIKARPKTSNTGERNIYLRKKFNRSGSVSNALDLNVRRYGKRYYYSRSIDVHTYDGAMRELKALRDKYHKQGAVK